MKTKCIRAYIEIELNCKGLALELNIEQDEYISALSPEAGVRVVIHKRGTYPFPEDEGINIAPGYMTSLGLKKVRTGSAYVTKERTLSRSRQNKSPKYVLKTWNIFLNLLSDSSIL
ncbi:hypothetical protein CHS0354_003925 [Potamilus streckersoni]|uniref:Uncharacterized protein n=1 Tax=Potamilus streckersoni TaxID=2493646 RepID=A0AAE0VNQ3_9BIVA|nr:hypothetical protein CHS0354_003925 [Potamilus streckersoni]